MYINPINVYRNNLLPFCGRNLQKLQNKATTKPRDTMTPEINKAEVVSSDTIYRKPFFPITSIKSAKYITNTDQDEIIKRNKDGSYTVDEETQTKVYYGKPALKLLKSGKFEHDTQIMLPKGCFGVMIKDEKEIPLPEDSAIQITGGTQFADIKLGSNSAYPLVITTERDFSWYDRYDKDSNNVATRKKYLELIYFASNVYNGKFTPNLMLTGKLKDEKYLKDLGIIKWEAKNELIDKLYEKTDLLSDKEKKEVLQARNIKNKLLQSGLATEDENHFLRLKTRYNEPKQRDVLRRNGFTEKEIEKILPILIRARQAKMDATPARKNYAVLYGKENIDKMKKAGLIVDNKKDTENIYWKDLFGNEDQLKQALLSAKDKDGNQILFSEDEIEEIMEAWNEENISGYDMSGLKYIDEDLAIYNLSDRINSWTQEETNWATNSTAASSTHMETPSIGISVVRYNDKNVISMNKLRMGEALHRHPNESNLKQYEVYFITHGKEVLDVKKNGVKKEVVIKPGELVVIKPSVEHCVNVVKGEVTRGKPGGLYEHICAQVPSAFHYGFGLKDVVPDGENPKEKVERGRRAINQRNYKGKINRLF